MGGAARALPFAVWWRHVRTRSRQPPHAFVYRAGIGLAGTHITCDASGFPSDLVFVSHAHALGAGGAAKLAGERAGRRQIVATEQTLRLLGEAGDKLRSRTLPAAFGRPFNLGGQRIELVPTGFLPGAAALLCETERRRLFYLGAFAPEPLLPGFQPADMRQADAICIDASFGRPGLSLPPRQHILAELRAFVRTTMAGDHPPVLLVSAPGTVAALAADLAHAGIPVRAHPRFAGELSRLHDIHPAIPAIARVARKGSKSDKGQLIAGEVVLWPSDARHAAGLQAVPKSCVALVSASAVEAEVVARVEAEQGFPLTHLPSHGEILAAIETSGAREVALYQAGAEELAEDLRGRGFDAYTLGPPRQMTLVA